MGMCGNLFGDEKGKFLNLCPGISSIIILLLILTIFLYGPKCERMHFDNADRTKNVIANAEIAQKIVEIHLYREDAGILRLNEELDYKADVDFDEQNYEWIVHFYVDLPDGRAALDSGRTIWIRRDDGRATNIAR